MICDVGYWEAAAYLFAAFMVGGIVGMTAIALLQWGGEE